ncbi:out at first protein isoform X2 [Ochlerotatus camptorhynchus]|uniref:out at first protein isoform X2 n=1 Tax=Ochlerotatus camptorhynchus TaxID=644619 RepID=UPI0031E11853
MYFKSCISRKLVIGFICLLVQIGHGITQLVINVQNQGGEVVQETITSSVSDDTCTLEFQRSDGTLITKLIDFKSKNPSTIRTPEEDKGKENYTMTGWVVLDRASPISRHIPPLCSEAQDSTYARDVDLKAWAELPGSSISILESAVKPFPSVTTGSPPSRCSDVSAIWAPCICSLEMCIGWYPCGLKYCKGKPDTNPLLNGGGGGGSSYRCGIKTCRKCHQYSYYVREKQQCLWDE